MKRGRFITFEGIDGAGKSTHLAWSADFLRRTLGVSLTLTREPGGTVLGEKLRKLLLTTSEPIHAETEVLLMFAARQQHLEEIIRPALMRGDWILCDRFTDSTFAYQSGGRGVAKEKIAALETWVHGDLQPDLTVLFDVSADVGKQRVAGIKAPDRFEREHAEFFKRVRNAYAQRMKEFPQRFVLINGVDSVPEIHGQLAQQFTDYSSKWKA